MIRPLFPPDRSDPPIGLLPGDVQRVFVRRQHPGFGLIEVIIAVAIMMLLAATVLPNLMGVFDRARVDNAEKSLKALIDGMSEMRADNQDWPGRLSHLVTPITTADLNICGSTYPVGKVGNWGGPYLDRLIPSTGVPVAIGIAQNQLVREVISGNDAYLIIQVSGVTEEDAQQLNLQVDADNSFTSGTVVYSAAGPDGLVTLSYRRPIRGC